MNDESEIYLFQSFAEALGQGPHEGDLPPMTQMNMQNIQVGQDIEDILVDGFTYISFHFISFSFYSYL